MSLGHKRSRLNEQRSCKDGVLYFEEGYQYQLECELANNHVAEIFDYITTAEGKLLTGSLDALRRIKTVLALT